MNTGALRLLHVSSCCVILLWEVAAHICISFGHANGETCALASYYSSHMVLQQQPHHAVIWGYTNIKGTVDVRVDNEIYKATVAPDPVSNGGVWKVVLDPMPAGGPHKMFIFCEAFNVVSTITLEDVMFGDVWLCSGQSNMAFSVNQSFNGTQELNTSLLYPDIRLMAVKQVLSEEVYYDLKGLYENWTRPSPGALGGKAAPFTYFSALCWFFGRDLFDKLKYPIGLISSNWGGTPIQAWSSPDVLKECSQPDGPVRNSTKMTGIVGGPHMPSCLWNSMIHPLLNLTIKGAIWYQGEANTPDPDPYKCLFSTMISDWREKWHKGTEGNTDPTFPFGFMQLCTSNEPSSHIIGPYPTLRWHQTYDYGYVPNEVLRNVFMAVGIDLPDLKSPYGPIHPRDKEDMGSRLALAGRAVAYGEELDFAGPFPTSFTVNTSAMTVDIQYDHGNARIKLIGKTGFEICCSTGTYCKSSDLWVPAEISSTPTPSSITISYFCYKSHAVAVRYLWRDMPCAYKNCPVYSLDSRLPGAPFLLKLKIFSNNE